MEMLVNAVENNSAALLANAAAAAAVVQANAAANALPVVPTVNAPTLMHGSADEVNSANPAGLVVNTAAQQLAVAAAAAVSQALQQSQVEQHAAILPTPSDGASLLESTSSNVEPPAQPSIVTSSPSFGQITSTLPPAPTMLSNHSADAALAAAAAALTSNIQQQQASAAPPSNTHPLLMAQQQTQQAQQHHQQQIALGAQLQAAAAVQAAQLHHATNAQQLHEQVLMQQQHQASQFLQAQAQAQSQQQQAAVVAANYTQLQQQQLAAAVAASQCIPGGLPPSTMVHSMLQPPSVVDLVAGQQQSMNGQHSTNLGQPMVVPAGSISSGAATLISAATGVPAQLQQTAFGVTIEHPSSMVSQVASQQPALLPTMLNAQMDTGGPVVGGAVVGGGNVQQPATHHTATSNSSQEMIAIPKDVLMKLVEHRIENDQQQQQQQMEAAKPAKCQCHCQCGRYPNELLIVDKVMTDLLENSSKQYNNNIDTDNTNRGVVIEMESNSSVNSNATPTSFLSNGGTSTQKNSLCGFDEQKVNPADYCNLTLNDQENLNELLRSNAVWNSEAGETQYGVTENGLRRLIRMISSVSGFRILDRYDQTLLLKYGCESYFVLRGTSSYNDTKISYLLQNRVSENIINFYKDFPVEWRNSETVILLLGMILLFDPQIPDLHNQLSVTVENMKYVLLLKHVLFTLCSQDINRSAQVFNELIARLDQLKTIGTLCQTENFEPIVQQMFEPQMVMATPSTTAIDTIISMANNNNNMSSM
uniref:NR LBD domain-containing protein n=1 Tax=Ditylenchus dipsaci TaxID=166011 RepID=A0A915DW31_9BILA